jgi:hypothetical protein
LYCLSVDLRFLITPSPFNLAVIRGRSNKWWYVNVCYCYLSGNNCILHIFLIIFNWQPKWFTAFIICLNFYMHMKIMDGLDFFKFCIRKWKKHV